MERVLKKGVYRHFKAAYMLYELIGEATHTETGEKLVIYRNLYEKENLKKGQIWARPKEMFISKVPAGRENPNNQEYRFEYIGEDLDV